MKDQVDDPLDWPARGFSARTRRIVFSATEAILADYDDDGNIAPARPEFTERGVAGLDHATGRASPDIRRAFNVLAIVLEWLPLFVIGKPSRMSRLPIAERVHYFEALEGHRFGLLSMLLVAFKVPICIPAFEEPPELFETGFDRESSVARRHLAVVKSAPIAPEMEAFE
jgi:hypothetical protein